MANLRPFLLIGFLLLGWMLWVEWEKDYGAATANPSAPDTSVAAPVADVPGPVAQGDARDSAPPGDLPEPGAGADVPQADTPAEPATRPAPGADTPLITVTTDVLQVVIDPQGGTVVRAELLAYPVDVDTPDQKVALLQRNGEFFIAQSGLISTAPAPNHTSRYEHERTEYALQSGEDRLRVPLTWRGENGLEVTKTFTFGRGDYVIEVAHDVANRGAAAWSGNRYEQLQRSVDFDEGSAGFNNPERYSFKGIAIYSPDEKYEKIDFDEVAEAPYDRSFAGGWLAMVQHYFFAAWIPPGERPQRYTTQAYRPDVLPHFIARATSAPVTVAPGERHEFSSRLFIGPKLQDELEEIAPGLEHTVNYGIFTALSKPLFWVLARIHDVVGNWGWSIVLLTLLIKILFYRLTKAQYTSMARMRKLQPRVEQLKERYGDDRQRMSQAMMELYKNEKVNPLGGCLPMLVQIPIFIALYWVLIESVELRQAPFILWIENLSARDPYYVLPALNAFFMIMTQRLTPTAGMDPVQRKMMNAMPIVFSVMFAFFPAGLVLYWATNAGLSLLQQWWITRQLEA